MLVRLPEAQARIREFYSALFNAWGRQHWWPADSAWEVIVGAFLTQNTAWTNVERAINNLRAADALSLEPMRALPLASLEQLIRPAGQHEVFVVDAYTRRILERHGLASTTAPYEDIRALFEAAFPSGTVVDELAPAHQGHKPPGANHPPSAMSEVSRSPRAQIFNEFHGLIVGVGKNYCQSRRVSCEECPLGRFLHSPIRLKMKQRSK